MKSMKQRSDIMKEVTSSIKRSKVAVFDDIFICILCIVSSYAYLKGFSRNIIFFYQSFSISLTLSYIVKDRLIYNLKLYSAVKRKSSWNTSFVKFTLRQATAAILIIIALLIIYDFMNSTINENSQFYRYGVVSQSLVSVLILYLSREIVILVIQYISALSRKMN